MELLEQTEASLKIVRLDLPGIASAADRVAPFSVQAMVEDLRSRFLLHTPGQSASTPSSWGILGVSLGGMTALDWVSRYPDDFSAAVIVNASARNLAPPQFRLKPSNLPTLIRIAQTRDPIKRELLVLKLNTTRHQHNRAVAAQWAQYSIERPIKPTTLIRQLVAGIRYTVSSRPTVPTLLISGGADRFVSPKCTARMAHYLNLPHIRHPTAGHDIALDDPVWLINQMLLFTNTRARVPEQRFLAKPSLDTDTRKQIALFRGTSK